MSTGNETLDRIQQEIQEALEREEELKNKYAKLNSSNNNSLSNGINGYVEDKSNHTTSNGLVTVNGTGKREDRKDEDRFSSQSPSPTLMNGDSRPFLHCNGNSNSNSTFRRFTPNPSAKGVMQKFLKMRGKLSATSLKPQRQPLWINDDIFEPAKVTVEKGKPVRNGFVPAEEKMKKELQDFQMREDELRKERRKSQPDLMAALEAEEIESNLKPAKSLAQMYNSNENLLTEYSSAPASLRPSRSLAQLCDADDEDLELPSTHSLIMQFESLKTQNA